MKEKKINWEKGKGRCDEKFFSGRVECNDLDPLREEEDIATETK